MKKEVNMKILVVYAHPNPQSFNHAILDAFTSGLSESGHTYEVVDLYAMRFNPCLDGGDLAKITAGKTPEDIRAEQERVSRAEGLVFIHPVWWAGAPAILKGWVDRVFSMGFAYTFEKTGNPVGLLKHRKGLVINTAGAGKEDAEASGMTETLNRAEVEGMLKFCGVQEARLVVFYNVNGTDDETRRGYLKEAKRLGKTF
jgi:NAD(P)H dehydrogenase (quinone)